MSRIISAAGQSNIPGRMKSNRIHRTRMSEILQETFAPIGAPNTRRVIWYVKLIVNIETLYISMMEIYRQTLFQ